MKKRILALLLATIMVIGMLAGCSNGGEGKDTTAATTKGDEIIDPVVTDEPDTEAADITVAPDTTTEKQYQEKPENEKCINPSLIEDAHLTSAELAEKYGGVKSTLYPAVQYNNSDHNYTFQNIEHEGRVEYIVLHGDRTKELFLGLEYPATAEKLEEEYGVELIHSMKQKSRNGNYTAFFTYKDLSIELCSQEENVFDEETRCHIAYAEYPNSPGHFGTVNPFYEIAVDAAAQCARVNEVLELLRSWDRVLAVDVYYNGERASITEVPQSDIYMFVMCYYGEDGETKMINWRSSSYDSYD